MVKIEYRVCDRCGSRIGYINWKARWFGKHFRKRLLLGRRTSSPYDYYDYGDHYYEFCNKCGQEVWDFIHDSKVNVQ